MALRNSRRGISIAVVLLVLSVVVVVALGTATVGVQNLNAANADMKSRVARYAAEAGIADAAYNLQSTPTWREGFTNKAMQSNAGASYSVVVTNNYSGSSTVTASDGTPVPASCVYLLSTGAYNNYQLGVKVLYQLNQQTGVNPFLYSAFGIDQVTLKGNATIDSYDSTKGAYGSGANNSAGHNFGADVGTNATDGTPISYNSHAANYGVAWVGAGVSDPDALVDGGGAEGGARALSKPVQSTPLKAPFAASSTSAVNSGTLAPGSYASLNATGTVQLQAGTYYFANGIDVSGTLLPPTSGRATIYFGGDFSFSGGTVGDGVDPSKIIVYGTKDARNVTAKGGGGSTGTMVLFAPTAVIDLQSSVVTTHGSYIGKTINVQSAHMAVHYDRNLQTGIVTLPAGVTFTKKLWRMAQ